MLDTPTIERIRHIFLHPRPHVSISQATSLLGWTRRQMTDALASGEIELRSTPLGKWFPREELMAKALEFWPLDIIEDALGPTPPTSSPPPSAPPSCASASRATTSPCSNTAPTSTTPPSATF